MKTIQQKSIDALEATNVFLKTGLFKKKSDTQKKTYRVRIELHKYSKEL